MDTTITTLEMCAGYSGIGLGIKNIFGERLRTIAYCELEGFAQANLISKMEKGLLDAAPIWSDLKTFPYESFHGLVDILIAGYPCQPFSSAGKRAGKEDPRHLWPWIADGIRLLQPTMCFFENVEGHISLGLSTVISDLEELGYKVSWGVFSAAECLDASGRTAPHQRKRVFIMAHRSGERLQGGKLCWKTRAQGESSGHFAECGSSMANSIMRGMSGSRNELGDSCEAGQGGKNPSQNSNDGNVWPSRPGQQQYAWEPPRVVGAMENTMRKGSSSARIEQNEECPANSAVASSGAEAIGNAADARWINCHSQNYGTQESGKGLVDHREICVSEIQPPLGGDADGTSDGLGHAELSGLSHQELAEICDWMVKTESRTDELRLLGNGVVPATATRAFLTLIEELNK